MSYKVGWTRKQLLIAFDLYCQIPFGKLHSRNTKIIKYANLIDRTPSALAMKLSNIASLDPEITSTGRKGLKGASAADKLMWKEMQNNWEDFAAESYQAISSIDADARFSDEQSSEAQVDYAGIDKITVTKTRIGQGFFRKAVLSAYNYRCSITGLSIPKLLVASHIIPWREDVANRLNPRNGLALSMLHDKAFDLGMITINEDMTVKISKKLQANNDFYVTALLSYNMKPILLPDKFQPHPDFLAYHREHVFEQNEAWS